MYLNSYLIERLNINQPDIHPKFEKKNKVNERVYL